MNVSYLELFTGGFFIVVVVFSEVFLNVLS